MYITREVLFKRRLGLLARICGCIAVSVSVALTAPQFISQHVHTEVSIVGVSHTAVEKSTEQHKQHKAFIAAWNSYMNRHNWCKKGYKQC